MGAVARTRRYLSAPPLTGSARARDAAQVLSIIDVVAPVLVALVSIVLMSLVPEPARQKLNAVVLAGAGAAYISGGSLGLWELAFTAAVTFCAFRGLADFRGLGVGWLLHTAWDVVHHLRGDPIIPELAHSSFGCAVCDPVIAVWLLRGAPTVRPWPRRRGAPPGPSARTAPGTPG
jgi:hypothetical protein